MIGLIIKNNLRRTAFMDLLNTFDAEPYQEGHSYQVLLTTDLCDCTKYAIPVITVGKSQSGEFAHIDTPVHPKDLIYQVQSALTHLNHQATFENNTFIFRSADRSLVNKTDGQLILLTEKENDLLSALATAYPNALDKEALLTQVWNYKPDTETHTLESHIYTLRQKIGPMADSLFQSTPTGYALITDLPE